MAGFQVTLRGRIWVTAEGGVVKRFSILSIMLKSR